MKLNQNYTNIRKKLGSFYPIENSSKFLTYIELFSNSGNNALTSDSARLRSSLQVNDQENFADELSIVEHDGINDADLAKIMHTLTSGAPRWRSPKLMYNVGASVNVVGSAAYSVALDENIFNINDGLAGNALIAEKAVSKILSKIAGLKTEGVGLFTFGGTATNMYAEKIGINKCQPNVDRDGIANNIKILITEDSHFSHEVSADWLGIGKNNVITMPADKDSRKSDIGIAETKAREILDSGNKLAVIIINGGTTYSHTVDDIRKFAHLRDRLVADYSLDYIPHLHVDSVIGWIWLWFRDYDFTKNELRIPQATLKIIQKQYRAISEVKYADSWGVDFHKGLGGCPVDCSVIMINNPEDVVLLSKTKATEVHQLASEFSFHSPVDYTLETSRSAGPALAAIMTIKCQGKNGYRSLLAGILDAVTSIRTYLQANKSVEIMNASSLGYVIMARLLPDDSKSKTYSTIELNEYNKEFFKWDQSSRMSHNIGLEYSFTSSFKKDSAGNGVAAIKLYPVSPHLTCELGIESIDELLLQKYSFDKMLREEKRWPYNS